MKFILQENKNSNIDYDAKFTYYENGTSTVIAYIHNLYGEDTGLEIPNPILRMDLLELTIQKIKGLKNG